MKKGIAVAGNILADKIKIIDTYPTCGMLSNILDQKTAVGGCVPNTGISLSKLGAGNIKISACGRIGEDDDGKFVKGMLEKQNIDTSCITIQKNKATSFSDVMTVEDGGARTFFHYRGTNVDFKPEDIDYDKLNCSLIHIGYALLLDCFDKKNDQYGTELAKALHMAKEKGIETSIDVVSEQSNRFKEIVSCSLKYCDYITLNEIESSNVCGIPLRDSDGKIIEKNLRPVCEWFMKNGVNTQVCIHFPEGCAAQNANGEYRQQPSLSLPKDYIKGAVGAGDAFCAGILYSAYNKFNLKDSLLLAVCAAACNLSAEDSISGMKSASEALLLSKKYGLRKEIQLL